MLYDNFNYTFNVYAALNRNKKNDFIIMYQSCLYFEVKVLTKNF